MTPRGRACHLFPLLLTVVTACEQPLPTDTPGAAPHPDPAALLSAAGGIGRPLPFLSTYERSLFDQGSVVFQTVFTPATGLGPLFNEVSCGECHTNPVVGGAGDDDLETHASAFVAGVCSDLSASGGPVVQDSMTPALHAATGLDRKAAPAGSTATGRRTTPSVLGFGLLDAVPDVEILALADPFDRNRDGISGRPNFTADGRLGRFGRKAQVATLREFMADAFVNEMGITSPAQQTERTLDGSPLPAGVDATPDPEITQEQLDAADAFVRFLAPPQPKPRGFVEELGGLTFLAIGCAGCHVPALLTGPSPVSALRYRPVYAYTDLLLHDMGPELADICLGRARPSEYRTEPLMGLRFKETFLHDGRAETIDASIRLHGGEATATRNRYVRLLGLQRAAVVRFLGGL